MPVGEPELVDQMVTQIRERNGETVIVGFKVETTADAVIVFLQGSYVPITTGGLIRKRRLPKDDHYFLRCEMIGAVGATLKITEIVGTGASPVERTVVDTKIPEGDDDFKVCNGPVCRFLVMEIEIPGG